MTKAEPQLVYSCKRITLAPPTSNSSSITGLFVFFTILLMNITYIINLVFENFVLNLSRVKFKINKKA